jgi:hypothetical protein
MTRKRSSLPTYLLHKPTGQARCRIDGKDIYLGPYGSDSSRIKYGQLVAKLAGGVPIDPLADSNRGRPSRNDSEADPVRLSGNSVSPSCGTRKATTARMGNRPASCMSSKALSAR